MDSTFIWTAAGSGAVAVGVVATAVVYRARSRSRSARERPPQARTEPASAEAVRQDAVSGQLADRVAAVAMATEAAEPVLAAAAVAGVAVMEAAAAEAPAGPVRAAVLAPPPVLVPPTGPLPAHVRGRGELLARLCGLLAGPEPDGRAQVLAGPGGTGKSTVALWLAREADRQGRLAWWVPAADGQILTAILLELAASAGARPGEVAQAKAGEVDPADLLWRYLDQAPPWLLVFDSADDPAALKDSARWLRRTAAGLIVVTSRNGDARAWGADAELHAVGGLDRAVGGQLLRDRAPRGGPARRAAALSERLTGLPLALHLAGSGLAAGPKDRRTFGRYAKALDDLARRPADAAPREPEHEQTEREHRHEQQVAVTSALELALGALAADGRDRDGDRGRARALLEALSCLAPAVEVPAVLLSPRGLGHETDDDAPQAAGPEALSRAGLVAAARDEAGMITGVTVHRLVSEGCRARMDAAGLARAGGTAAAMLSVAAAELTGTTGELTTTAGALAAAGRQDWPAWLRIMPHLCALYEHAGGRLAHAGLAAASDVAAAAALAFLAAGSPAEAASLAADALRQAERLGPEHEAVLALRGVVAMILARQGASNDAEQEFRDVLATRVRVLGPDHPGTLATRCQIAGTLADQGQYDQAERELRDVLAAQVRVLGPADPGALATRFEIGRTLARRGDYQRAEAEFRDLLGARDRAASSGDPDTLAVRYQLARLLAQRGEYEQAERLLRDLLADSAVLGADDPSTLTTRQEFALLLAERGKYDQAARELRDLLTARVRVLGPEHRQTRLTRRWLSYVAARDAGVRSE